MAGMLEISDYFSNRDLYLECQWIAKGISWIDPAKEARANRTAMISYQTTLEEVAAEQGKDWREILEQRAKEEKLMKELGLEVIQDGYSKQKETTPQEE